MSTQSRPKRIWRPWYQLPVPPLCPDCQVVCIVKHTGTAPDGRRIQHRYCPQCHRPNKTTYLLPDASPSTNED